MSYFWTKQSSGYKGTSGRDLFHARTCSLSVFTMGSVARTIFLKRVSMGLTFSRWAKKMTVVVIGVLVTVKSFPLIATERN